MDLSRIRIPSPLNRAWYRYVVFAYLGIITLLCLAGALGIYSSWELNLLMMTGGACVLGVLGALLLFSDDKKMWGFSYLIIAILAIIIGLLLHASSIAIAESFRGFSP